MEGRELRPLGVGEILDAAINIYFRNFGLLLKVAATVAIPLAVIVFILDQVAFAEPDGFSNAVAFAGEYRQPVDRDTFVTIALIEVAVSVLAYLVITGACFRAVSELYLSRRPLASDSIRFATRRVHSLLWVSFLVVLGTTLGFLAFVIPGIWLLVAWSVAVPALLLEDAKGTKALGRSFGLIRNNWWRVFGALIIGYIFIGLFQFLIGLGARGLTSLTDDNKIGSLLIIDGAQALTAALTAPLLAAIVTVIYYDLRVRKEAFDVELLAANLDSPGSASPSPAAGSSPPPPGGAPPLSRGPLPGDPPPPPPPGTSPAPPPGGTPPPPTAA